MKTLLKLILVLVLLSALAVVTLGLALLFSSTLQRSIAVRVLEGNTSGTVELAHIRLGLGHVEVRGLRLESDNGILGLDSLEARFDTWSLFGAEPRVRSLQLAGSATLPDDRSFEFEAMLDESESGKGGAFTADLVALARIPGAEGPLTAGIHLSPEIRLDRSGEEVSLAGPVRLSGPESETNGTISAKFKFGGEAPHAFALELELDRLVADEWQVLLGALSEEEAPAERDPSPDKTPPWSMLDGKATVRLGELSVGPNTFTDLTLVAEVVQGRRLNVQTGGKSGSAPLQLQAALDFQAERPERPYVLSGTVDVQGLDVAPLLKNSQSRQPPILEGVFNLTGSFQSTAPNPSFLADRMIGSATLQSAGQGRFRPLGEKTSLAGGVSGLLGSLTGSVRELAWVQLVIDQLKEIPYSQMQFEVAREPDLDFVLRNLDLVSRETRIQGQGTIGYSDGVPLLQLPIDMRFQLSAKGRLAEALRTGKQLRSEQPDALGFLQGPPLPLKGTLGEPESLLMNILMESGSQLLPGLFR